MKRNPGQSERPRHPRRHLSALVAALTMLVASTAGATQVEAVRVGRHETFTRVVFELDRHTGYRIERHEPAAGIAELVITLDATAAPLGPVETPKSLIESIDISALGSQTVARIRLARDGLRLKEMILAKPARIVLDVIAPVEPAVAASIVVAASPPPVARAEPVDETPSVAVAEPDIPEVEIVEPEAEVASEPEFASAEPVEPAEEQADVAPAAEPTTFDPPEIPAVVTPQIRKVTRRVQPAAAADSLFSSLPGGTWGAAGIGFLLLVGAVAVMRRRRGDDFEDDDDAFDPHEVFAGDNPFTPEAASAVADEELADDAGDPSTEQTDTMTLPPQPEEPDSTTPAALPSEEESAGGDTMDSFSETLSSDDSAASAVLTAVGAQVDEAGSGAAEVLRLVQELDSRVAKLEMRLEEAVDARERMERQVGAQTEELRVQRAAIARTQRAVRNLNQPVDDNPTEPALKQPE